MFKKMMKKRVFLVWLILGSLLVAPFVSGAILDLQDPLTFNYDLNSSNCEEELVFSTNPWGRILVSTGFDWQQSLKPTGNACCDFKDNGVFNRRPSPSSDGSKNVFMCHEDNNIFTWENAQLSNNHFKIKTIGKYDYISNSQEWIKCDDSLLNQGLNTHNLGGTAFSKKAARFLCTKIDNQYTFLECCDGLNCVGDITGRRYPGDSTTLVLTSPITASSNDPDVVFPPMLEAPYTVNMTNWEGMEAFELFFTITKNWDYEIEIIGNDEQTLFRDKLMNYVVTEPAYNKEMHAVIPIGGWGYVEGFRLHFKTENEETYDNNRITFHKGFLRPTDSSKLKFCSSARYKESVFENKWIGDLDDNTLVSLAGNYQELVGEKACNEFGYDWTGSQCCGDDATETNRGEIYEDKSAACWIGEALANNTAVMDIIYDLEYNSTKDDLQPISKTVTLEISWTDKYPIRTMPTRFTRRRSGTAGTTLCCPSGYVIDSPAYYTRVHQCAWQQSSGFFNNCAQANRVTDYNNSGQCINLAWTAQGHRKILVDVDIGMVCKKLVKRQKNITVQVDFAGSPKQIDLNEIIGDKWADGSEIKVKWNHPGVMIYFADQGPTTSTTITTTKKPIPLVGFTSFKAETHSCWVYRDSLTKKYGNSQSPNYDIQDSAVLTCNPSPCGPNMISLGYLDEYNEYNGHLNRQEICVEGDNVVGEVVSCKYVLGNTKCNLPACTKGSLQFTLEEIHDNPNGAGIEKIKYGICSNLNMKTRKCIETDFDKTRICKVDTQGLAGYNLINWPSTVTGNWRDGQASFQDRYVSAPGNPNIPVYYYYHDFYFGGGMSHSSGKINKTLNKTFNHTCTTNTCDIPLAGMPPYTIVNKYPLLYDLYFVNGTGDEVLVNASQKSFNQTGNLKAKRVPLQVLSFNGSLYSCQVSNFMNKTFIDPVGLCEVKGDGFCAGKGGWQFGDSGGFASAQRDTFKQSVLGSDTSADNYLPESCCPASACWNGTGCVADMSGKLPQPQYNFSCIDGDWTYTPPLLTWDKIRTGFCPQAGDCLVEPNGNGSLNYNPDSWFLSDKAEDKPICIADQQFILDNFCENNVWESRTKKIATQLLNLVNNTGDVNSYTLYCDNHSNAFSGSDLSSIMEYIIGPKPATQSALIKYLSCHPKTGDNCVNNFCILDYDKTSGSATGKRRVIATSLNKPINDSVSSFLYALGQTNPTYCNGLSGTGVFKNCGDGKTWYAPSLNSIVAGSAVIEMGGFSFVQSIINWFKNPIKSIINWMGGYSGGQVQKDYSFVSNTTQMKVFYSAARTNGKKITAVMEEVNQTQFILAKYENFTIDMCSFVTAAAKAKGINASVASQNAACNQTGRNYTVFIDNNLIKSMPNIWQQLTAKLRVT